MSLGKRLAPWSGILMTFALGAALAACESTEPESGGATPCSLDAACGPGQVCDKVAQICVTAEVTPDVQPDTPSTPDVHPDTPVSPDVDDVAPDGPGPDPCLEGAQGCPCEKGGDCAAGYCVDVEGEKLCSAACTSGSSCVEGLSCLPTGSDKPGVPSHLCLAPDAKLCQPCATDQDCMEAGGGAGVSLCLDYGGEGRFCGGFCGEDGLCPDGYACEAATSVDGSTSSLCRRLDALCPCDGLSRLLGLGTTCGFTNDIGTCTGGRFCGPTGLTDCDAAEATDEVCDGEDNNCDGAVDEATCDDGLACTVDTCDTEAAACSHLPDDSACDDGVACTNDLCDLETGGCTHEANDGACDDGDQ